MPFRLFDLGLVDFFTAWQEQKKIFTAVKEGFFPAALLFCQHYPAITLGRQTKKNNLRVKIEELGRRGIFLYTLERGGDITYHGPGQLLAYPIFNLRYFGQDIHLFLRRLEEAVIKTLASFDIFAQRKKGFTGVWVENKKISSIGIAIRNWITLHGLALNVESADLENFSLIRPCGMDIEMTAMEAVLGRNIAIGQVKEKLIAQFQLAFEPS